MEKFAYDSLEDDSRESSSNERICHYVWSFPCFFACSWKRSRFSSTRFIPTNDSFLNTKVVHKASTGMFFKKKSPAIDRFTSVGDRIVSGRARQHQERGVWRGRFRTGTGTRTGSGSGKSQPKSRSIQLISSPRLRGCCRWDHGA